MCQRLRHPCTGHINHIGFGEFLERELGEARANLSAFASELSDAFEVPQLPLVNSGSSANLAAALAFRTIQHMMSTTFWSSDGRPMSAAQFLENMFGALPEFFKNEAELRTIWSKPDTRKALLTGLSDKGYGRDTMVEMQQIIEAENSDLYDVLAYVAFALHPQTRAARADKAKILIYDNYSDKQRGFLEFVLAQYVK